MAIQFQDKLPAPTSRTMKDSGELVAPCVFAREGVMNYLARELSPLFDDLPPNQVVRVMRTMDELYKDSVLEALKSAPITIGHPKEDVCVANYKDLAVGVLSGLPHKDEDSQGLAVLAGELVLNDQTAIDLTNPDNPQGKNGLSLGYTADLVRVNDSKDWDAIQCNIKPNHIAIVPVGRAGSEYRIGDSDAVLEQEAEVIEAKATTDAANNILDGVNNDSESTQVETDLATVQSTLAETEVKLADSLGQIATLTAQLEAAQDALAAKKDLRFSDEDINSLVNKKVSFLVLVKQFSDEDFSNQSEQDIKRTLVTAKFGDMSAKTDEYVDARFQIMLEDEEPSVLGKIMHDAQQQVLKDSQPKPDEATVARSRMMAGYTNEA